MEYSKNISSLSRWCKMAIFMVPRSEKWCKLLSAQNNFLTSWYNDLSCHNCYKEVSREVLLQVSWWEYSGDSNITKCLQNAFSLSPAPASSSCFLPPDIHITFHVAIAFWNVSQSPDLNAPNSRKLGFSRGPSLPPTWHRRQHRPKTVIKSQGDLVKETLLCSLHPECLLVDSDLSSQSPTLKFLLGVDTAPWNFTSILFWCLGQNFKANILLHVHMYIHAYFYILFYTLYFYSSRV